MPLFSNLAIYCVKSVQIRTRKNSVFGHFSRSYTEEEMKPKEIEIVNISSSYIYSHILLWHIYSHVVFSLQTFFNHY